MGKHNNNDIVADLISENFEQTGLTKLESNLRTIEKYIKLVIWGFTYSPRSTRPVAKFSQALHTMATAFTKTEKRNEKCGKRVYSKQVDVCSRVSGKMEILIDPGGNAYPKMADGKLAMRGVRCNCAWSGVVSRAGRIWGEKGGDRGREEVDSEECALAVPRCPFSSSSQAMFSIGPPDAPPCSPFEFPWHNLVPGQFVFGNALGTHRSRINGIGGLNFLPMQTHPFWMNEV